MLDKKFNSIEQFIDSYIENNPTNVEEIELIKRLRYNTQKICAGLHAVYDKSPTKDKEFEDLLNTFSDLNKKRQAVIDIVKLNNVEKINKEARKILNS